MPVHGPSAAAGAVATAFPQQQRRSGARRQRCGESVSRGGGVAAVASTATKRQRRKRQRQTKERQRQTKDRDRQTGEQCRGTVVVLSRALCTFAHSQLRSTPAVYRAVCAPAARSTCSRMYGRILCSHWRQFPFDLRVQLYMYEWIY